MIQKRVDGDAPEPGVKTRFAAKTADRAVGFQPNLLRQIFSVRRVAAIMQSQQIETALVTLCQQTKRFSVSGLRASNQFRFAQTQLVFPFPSLTTIDTV